MTGLTQMRIRARCVRTCCFARALLMLWLAHLGEIAAQDFTYTTNNGTITITRYTGPGGAVIIPSTIDSLPVTRIGDRAFDLPLLNTTPTSVTIPDSVMSIGNSAFESCANLMSVAIPNGVVSIGESGFAYCSRLTTLTLGNGLASIGSAAFSGCGNLRSVTIPSSVTNMAGDAFNACNSLTAITVDPLNSVYSSVDGVLFDKAQTTILRCPGGRSGSYLIPVRVISVETGAFSDCISLSNVTFGSNLASIGSGAFFSCTNLTTITIPDNVTNIGVNAFWYCINLRNVNIGNGVTVIGSDSFQFCVGLISVTIGKSVAEIGDGAFYNCFRLKAIYFLGNPPSFGSQVFDFDNNATVYYLAGTTGWSGTFAGVPAKLWNPQVQTSDSSFGVQQNGFGFKIAGTADIPLAIEASTKLAAPSWVLLQSCTLTNGLLYFSDPQWTNYPGRFYRIRSP